MDNRVVLVTELRSSLGVSGVHEGLLVADIRHPDAVESMLADLARVGEIAVVTYAQADHETVRRMVTYAQVRRPDLRVALEPLPGPPLAVGTASSLADDIDGGDDTFAWRLAALDLLRQSMWSAVWLPKVSGLSHPSPRLVQHVRSWFPGAGFLAVHTPDPRVLSAGKAPIEGLETLPDHALLHSSTAASPPWVLDAVRAALEPASVSEMMPVREQIDAFGTEAALELVTVPLNYHEASRPIGVRPCEACGARHGRHACPVCGMTSAPFVPATLPGDPQ